MTRAGVGAVVAFALAAGLVLRLARLDVRPMHHDEANQAVKFGALLERGEYRYDAHDHHGPTLYFLSLPAAWLRGQSTLASLDEWTLRGVTVVFGAATILLLPLVGPALGRTAVAGGALLMALSPAMVFYSRMFIQESLFACFTLAFVIAVGRAGTVPGLRTVPESGTAPGSGTVPDPAWSTVAGVAAGLAIATKETSLIVLPAALVACAIARWSPGSEWRSGPRPQVRWVVGAVAMAAAVAALFYSSFFTFPRDVIEPLLGIRTYLDRGVDPARHAHPWHYYLRLVGYSSAGGLRWSEGLVLALAIVGAVTAWLRPDRSHPERAFWTRYLAYDVAITAAIFSIIPYKTPWNLLPFYVVAIVLAGAGFSSLVHLSRSRVFRGAIVLAFVVASAQLAQQAWRASVTYASDPRNPYVYAQTVPDAIRMAERIRRLAAVHPDGNRMQVSVIAPPYEQWPSPWYLRMMPNVGYWTAPGDALALQAPVVVASMEYTDAVDKALGDRYESEFFGLRPEVLLSLYVERRLWRRFLATAADSGSAAECTAGESAPQRCGRAAAVALWRATSAP